MRDVRPAAANEREDCSQVRNVIARPTNGRMYIISQHMTSRVDQPIRNSCGLPPNKCNLKIFLVAGFGIYFHDAFIGSLGERVVIFVTV